MNRLVRAAAASVMAAAVVNGAGCALELVPQSAGDAPSSRHAGTDTWASEPSSRWTISIKPDSEDDASAVVAASSAVSIPSAAPLRSEPLAPGAPRVVSTAKPSAEIQVTSETDGVTAAASASAARDDLSRVVRLEPATPPAAAEPRYGGTLPTYVSPRATAPVDLTADDADAPATPPSASQVAATASEQAPVAGPAPYVIEPPRHGGGEPRDPSDGAADDLLDPEYRIGVEDLLDVSLLGEPDLQHVAMRVSPRGTVDFPYAGTLTAAGLSVDEFRNALLEKLDDYYVSPQVTVFLREYRSRMVHILGEVPRPGPFKLTHRNTLMEVLSRAGGFTPLANKGDVQIIRSDAAGKRILHVDVNEIIDDGRIDLDIPLESGDVINVPERLF